MSETLPAVTAAGGRFDVVPLLGEQILAARVGDQVRVVMKPFCEAIGLAWEPQRKRIMRDELLAEGTSMMEVPSDGGPQQALTLPLELVPGFLFGADAKRYAPELRDKVRAFRAQCYAVLHAHFFDRQMPAPVIDLPAITGAARESVRLMLALKREHDPEIRRFYHQLLGGIAAAQGVDVPPIDAIGAAARDRAEVREIFFHALEQLSELGFNWQHGNTPGLLTFDLGEVLEACARRQISMPRRAEIEVALRECSFVAEAATMRSAQTGTDIVAWTVRDPHHG